jgi:membrane protease YdiL (CAAX protease family)
VWWVLLPAILVVGVEQLMPSLPTPAGRDIGAFLRGSAGQDFLPGNWPWFGLIVVMAVFNTVLGEELLFRGYLLPRMCGAFRRSDWLANGVLFALYHLHQPWTMPEALLDTLALAYPTRRYTTPMARNCRAQPPVPHHRRRIIGSCAALRRQQPPLAPRC